MRHRILIVDDDEGLRTVLNDMLTNEGFATMLAADGKEGVSRATSDRFDLILLDVALPRQSGLEVCRELRARGVGVPILMLSGRSETQDRVLGLRLGADDYVTKPFEAPELLARIDALIRRWHDPRWAALAEFQFGAVQVDFVAGHASRNGVALNLPVKELQLLRHLIARRGSVVSREELLRGVWGAGAMITRTVDVHIATLRNKVEEEPHSPRYILTIRGKGYLFQD